MMEYLQSWQSKFLTCHEVWEEGSKKAMAIHLLPAEELYSLQRAEKPCGRLHRQRRCLL